MTSTTADVTGYLRLSSSSSKSHIGRRSSSVSGGHWRSSLHLSMLLGNLADLLWTSHVKSFQVFLLVSCSLLVSNSWLRLRVCLPSVSVNQLFSSSELSLFQTLVGWYF